MDKDINDRNYENYVDIGGKPVRRVTTVDSNGNLVNPATSDNQTDGSQKTQIVDGSNVNIPIATETKQDSILAELQQKTEPTDVQLAELIPLFRALLLAIANPSYVDKSANATRIQVQSGTVTTVTTVTNLTNVGSFTADHLQRMANINAWASNIRNLIT